MVVLYARGPARATRQILGDALVVVWAAGWWAVSDAMRGAVQRVADTSQTVVSKSDSVAENLDRAGDRLAKLPLVGDQVSESLHQSGSSVRGLSAAGTAQVQSLHDLAMWVGWGAFLLPLSFALALWLPGRMRFIRDATTAARFVDADPDLELFALRAMANQPMRSLAKISDDPVGAWRDGDRDVVTKLARLELESCGLRLPKRPRSRSGSGS